MKKIVVLYLVLGLSKCAFAGTPIITVYGEEIVVTAHREEVKRADSPAVVDIITREEIENSSASNLTEILKKRTGVDVVEYPGVLSGVNLRGFAPELSNIKHHSLLVNGRRAGVINLSTILLGDIERIEVLKGPASSLYGAEAMAGVINIITKKSKGRPEGKIDLEQGSFESKRIGVNIGGSVSKEADFDFSLTNIARTDYEVPEFTEGVFKWPGGSWRGNSFDNLSSSLRLGYEIKENHRLDLRGEIFSGEGIDNAGDIYGCYGPGKKELYRNSAELSYKGKNEDHCLKLQGFVANDKCDYYANMDWSTWSQVPWYKSNVSQDSYVGLQFQDTLKPFLNNELTIGIDWNKDTSISETYNPVGSRTSPYNPDQEKLNWAYFFEDKLSLFSKRLILTAGGRDDYYSLNTLKTPYFAQTYTTGKEELSSFNPRGGIVLKLGDNVRLHSSVGKAFVIPKPIQKAGFYTSWGKITRGNPELKPERSLSYDAGIELTASFLTFDVTYFSTDVKDKIQQKVGATENTFENLPEAEIRGVEVGASIELGKFIGIDYPIRLYSNCTKLSKARDVTNNKDVYCVAKLKINSGVEYLGERLNGGIAFRYVGKMKENNEFTWPPQNNPYPGQTEIEYGDFTVADINLSYKISRCLTPYIKVENLFDRYYQEKSGYPMSGRTIFSGMIISF